MTTADHHEHTVDARFSATDPNAMTREQLIRVNALAFAVRIDRSNADGLIGSASIIEAYIRDGGTA